MRTKQILFGIIAAGLFFTSCNKDKDEDESTVSSENNTQADAAFSHINDIVTTEVEKIEDEQFNSGKTTTDGDECATITFSLSDDSTYVDSVFIDYGTDGCEWNGRTRKGKMIISQDGKKKDKGTITKVELENFYVDDYKVEGVKTIENLGLVQGTLTVSSHVVVNGGKITSPDGAKTFQWNADRINVAGLDNSFKPFFSIEGTANGVNVNGTSFTITTSKPLKAIWGCPRIVEGVLNVTPQGMATRTLDYGDGTCDYKATITVNGNTKNIILW